nr:MAG TPA: Protein of unknown function (DUF551) [Caudoviricetes sp.]
MTERDGVAEVLRDMQEYRDLSERIRAMFGDAATLKDVVDSLERKVREPEKPDPVNARILTYEESDMWDAYRAIGTPEKCREAVECTRWIPVSERMPVPEEEVLVTAVSRYGETEVVPAIYEDGTMLENDSIWNWEELDGEWDEENECQIIPEAWWENRKYNPDCTYNCIIDDKVVAWMPLPEPYHIEEEQNEQRPSK